MQAASLPLIILLAGVVGAAVLGLLHLTRSPSGKERGAADDGPSVAEVWLEWPLCRGSTLYRQRFVDDASAERAARRAAQILDDVLPKHYADTDSSGNRILLEHEYGIYWGVRPALAGDTTGRIWSPVLPGRSDYRGEHARAHPLWRDPEAQAASLGFKV